VFDLKLSFKHYFFIDFDFDHDGDASIKDLAVRMDDACEGMVKREVATWQGNFPGNLPKLRNMLAAKFPNAKEFPSKAKAWLCALANIDEVVQALEDSCGRLKLDAPMVISAAHIRPQCLALASVSRLDGELLAMIKKKEFVDQCGRIFEQSMEELVLTVEMTLETVGTCVRDHEQPGLRRLICFVCAARAQKQEKGRVGSTLSDF
jgi:hypothetical protein